MTNSKLHNKMVNWLIANRLVERAGRHKIYQLPEWWFVLCLDATDIHIFVCPYWYRRLGSLYLVENTSNKVQERSNDQR